MMFYISQNTQMRCTHFFCELTSKMGPISVARGARRRSHCSTVLGGLAPRAINRGGPTYQKKVVSGWVGWSRSVVGWGSFRGRNLTQIGDGSTYLLSH